MYFINRSQNGNIHLMLHQPSDWKRVIGTIEATNVSAVELHFGLSSNVTHTEEDWKESLKGILDTTHPFIVYVHQSGNQEDMPFIMEMMNKMKYLMQRTCNTWLIWSW